MFIICTISGIHILHVVCILNILHILSVVTCCVYYAFYSKHILHIQWKMSSPLVFHSLLPQCLMFGSQWQGPYTTTDICQDLLLSDHNLRPESQQIHLASRRASLQYRRTEQEEAAPVWRTLEQHISIIRLEQIHGASRRWLRTRLTGRHPRMP